ncbi:MAG: CHAT domain-containing protein, partial [Bacteroidetes bacterium]|nr:CHAT domain-containing protein [Bacteroidota bacterium]
PIGLIGLLLSGCGETEHYPKEKAERLAMQATIEMGKQNYEEAERLLAECVDIHAEANNDAKLAENYATLSSAQTSAGKIGPALETLTALRELYKSAADRNAELHTMFEMSKLHFRLGNTVEALRLLQEAFSNSTLFRLEDLHALAGLEAGKLHAVLGTHEQAIPYLTTAQRYFKSVSDIPRLVETTTALISSFTAVGKTDAAYTLFQEIEAIFAQNNPSLDRPKFYRSVGDAFFHTGDAAFARANYLQAISILKQNNSATSSRESILALLELGELYFSNFSFPEAQQYFVAGYNLSKQSSDDYLQAYLLTRISDCLLKVSVYRNAKDGMIRAAQLYEQAHTLFARMGFGLGEAISTHRLGMLKELTGDESAAITFYKRAFEKYLDNTMSPVHYHLSIPAEQLFMEPSQQYSPNDWFAERLVALLIKFKRYQEALTYHETMRSVALQQQLSGIAFEFRDPGKRKRYSDFDAGLKEKHRMQLELFHLTSINRNYASKLQQQLKFIRSKVESDAITLMREYPVFSYIGFSQQSLRQMIDSKLPSGTTVLDFCIANNDVWAFVITPGEPVDAVKLSSNGTTIKSMMYRFVERLSSPSVQRSILADLSTDLYSVFMKQFETLPAQKIVIIPPVGYAKFPFHALSDGAKQMMEARTIVYLPHLSLINSTAQTPRFINNVVAFGFTPDFRWGLEFELRDIRSFFRNTQVHVNQSATIQRLNNALGEILQVSSQYKKDENGVYTFSLSDGSSSKSGTTISTAKFTALHPFQIVYLSDVQSATNSLSDLHPLVWLLNGSAGVVANQFPISSSISKTFGEQFYSSLSLELNPSQAYRKGILQLGKKKELREGYSGASYFYYGIR